MRLARIKYSKQINPRRTHNERRRMSGGGMRGGGDTVQNYAMANHFLSASAFYRPHFKHLKTSKQLTHSMSTPPLMPVLMHNWPSERETGNGPHQQNIQQTEQIDKIESAQRQPSQRVTLKKRTMRSRHWNWVPRKVQINENAADSI